MTTGQGVLSAAVLDVAELDRMGARIEDRERRRSSEHAEQLVDALTLLMSCSEQRARLLLCDAQVLDRLGALGAMRRGWLTVEQARVVIDLLGPAEDALGASLWERLAARLSSTRSTAPSGRRPGCANCSAGG